MMVVQEEIFGPVIVVSNFKDEKEVVELANSTIYSLAAAVFTNDANQQTRLAQQIDAGTIWLNQYGILYPNVPFGGFKHSRIGRDSGTYGLEAYQQVKAVHQNLTQTM
ncbi:hypothetical protein I302_106428 [Kwoniella bestiolae CBS 10118]